MTESFSLLDVTTGVDLTPWIISYEWSGDLEQAGRKLNFKIAYTTKDQAWTNPTVNLGDEIMLYCIAPTAGGQFDLFHGKIFMQSRESSSYEMEFVAYDKLIYLGKSKYTLKFSKAPVKDVLSTVASKAGLTLGRVADDLTYTVDFVADGMTGTEIIKKALFQGRKKSGKSYHIYLDAQDKLNVVRADTIIQGYAITDMTNLTTASHSASIEDMVNRVEITDKDGHVIGAVTNSNDVKAYGTIQGVYKVDNKQDTQASAKALLKSVSEHSEVEALGNIQCIAGYAVEIQEEQLKGNFLIVSDSHTIENNRHMMKLTLRYLDPEAKPKITTEGNTSGGGITIGNIDEGMSSGEAARLGATMDNGTEGCVEAATKVGSYYSQFLAQEQQAGVVNVDTLCADAGDQVIDFDASQLEKGDVIVYGDNDHVVIYDGQGGYIGNSSSQDMVVHGSDYNEMGSLTPSKIIKTSRI